MAEALSLRLLGTPLVEDGRGPVSLSRRKSAALLARLALEPTFHARDSLAAFLWPDCSQSRARANLRSCLFEIARASGREALVIEQDRVLLPRESRRLDVEEFRALAAPCPSHRDEAACERCAPSLEAAARLWRDEFMAGFSLAGCGPFDDWQRSWAERLRAEYRALLARLVEGLERMGRLAEAEGWARRWIEAEPYEEEARRRQIGLLLRMGKKAQAIERFDAWSVIAVEELGGEPDAETRALVERHLRAESRGAYPGRSPARGSTARQGRDQAGIVGREAELSSLGRALASPDLRLLTIVGTGGLGKTLLARELLDEGRSAFPGGAFFVELASIRDAALVPQAVAGVLGVTESSRGGLVLEDAIAARLGGARSLLALDNFEQVLPARGFVSRLLSSNGSVAILATSRERLGIEGETVFELQPLGFPSGPGLPRAADRARYPALELLARRAEEAEPAFELSDGNAAACAALCARLEGLPLALELAASRFSLLAPAELLERLDRSPGLVAAPRGTSSYPERHRSLEAVIAWSYELLEPGERELFDELSVFVGSFDLEAAEALGGRGADLVDTLSSLVDKSLLRREAGASRTRFRFLEPIRDFAAGRLALRADRDDIRRAQARHFLDRAERLAPGLYGPGQLEALERLGADEANFRAAVDRLVAAGEGEEAYRLCEALSWQWYRSGRFAWGEGALRAALDADGSSSASARRGRCLRALGWLRFVQGAWREARSTYEEAASILGERGDAPGLARCLSDLGVVERWLGDRASGDGHCLEAARMARTSGEALPLAYALIWAYATTGGKSVDNGQRDGLEEAIALAREAGDPWAEAHALDGLGDYLREQGKASEAAPCFEAALVGFEALGDNWMRAWTLEGLARNARVAGDPTARARLREALALFARLGDRSDALYVVGELGLAAMEAGDRAEAALLLGARSAQGERLGLDPAKADAAALPVPEWARGRVMSYEGILAFALRDGEAAATLLQRPQPRMGAYGE